MIVRCICGKNLRVPDQHKGKKVRCPSCGETFIVRETPSAITPSVAAPVPTRPKTEVPTPRQVEGKSVKKSPKPTGHEPRSSSVLLVASGGLGVLALLGFIASGVLFVLGLNATPTYRPIAVPPQAKADQKVVGNRAPKQPAPAAPAAPQPPLEKAKDEIVRFSNLHVGTHRASSRISIRNDDRQVLIESGGGLLLGDLEKGSILRTFPSDKPARGFTGVQFLPDGKQAVASRLDQTIEVLDLETGKAVRSFAAKTRLLLPLAVSADGRHVIGGGDPNDRFLHQWDVASGRESARTDELPSSVQTFSASADGKRVLLDCRYLPFLWDIEKGGKVRRLSPPSDPYIVHFALSPDGRHALFVTGKRLLLWDVDRDEEIARFDLERGLVYAAFAPDGRRALVASDGIEFRNGRHEPTNSCFWLYDLDRRTQVRRFDGHFNSIRYLAFTHDGQRAVSYAEDRTLRVWQLPAPEEESKK